MAFKLPTLQNINNIFNNTLQALIPELNPNLPQSWSGYLSKSNSLVASQYNDLLREAYNDNFILLANRDALILKGEELGIPLLLATQSSGILVANADVLVPTILANSQFTINGLIFENVNAVSAILKINVINSVNYNALKDQTEIITDDVHNLVSDLEIEIDATNYNVHNLISEFEFSIDGDVTGAIVVSNEVEVNSYLIDVFSLETGLNQNVNGDIPASTNVISTEVRSSFAAIVGGTDVEKTEDYRNRLLNATTIRGGCLTSLDIEILLNNNGFSFIIFNAPFSSEGGDPDVGITKIYTLRKDGNQASVLEKTEIKNLILENLYPVNDDPDNLFILDTSLIPEDFEISNLKMQTTLGVVDASQSMRNAVIESLNQFFLNEVLIGENVPKNKYTNAVERAIDDFGNTVASSTIINPAGVIVVNSSQKAVLGDVDFV